MMFSVKAATIKLRHRELLSVVEIHQITYHQKVDWLILMEQIDQKMLHLGIIPTTKYVVNVNKIINHMLVIAYIVIPLCVERIKSISQLRSFKIEFQFFLKLTNNNKYTWTKLFSKSYKLISYTESLNIKNSSFS